MKKSVFIAIFALGVAFSAQAQISTDQLKNTVKSAATTTTAKAGLDVKSLASGIMGKLTPALALTSVQKPKVLTAVSGFLKDKSSILQLATTNKAAYATKLAGLTSTLSTKLKGILTAAQYAKFLGLKPATASTSNVLSQLFF
jgi:hypothetical protein